MALPWFQRPLVSLGHPPFRLFWMSNLVFAVGLMVQFTARGWLTVQLTDSALVLGLVEGVFISMAAVAWRVVLSRTVA